MRPAPRLQPAVLLRRANEHALGFSPHTCLSDAALDPYRQLHDLIVSFPHAPIDVAPRLSTWQPPCYAGALRATGNPAASEAIAAYAHAPWRLRRALEEGRSVLDAEGTRAIARIGAALQRGRVFDVPELCAASAPRLAVVIAALAALIAGEATREA